MGTTYNHSGCLGTEHSQRGDRPWASCPLLSSAPVVLPCGFLLPATLSHCPVFTFQSTQGPTCGLSFKMPIREWTMASASGTQVSGSVVMAIPSQINPHHMERAGPSAKFIHLEASVSNDTPMGVSLHVPTLPGVSEDAPRLKYNPSVSHLASLPMSP